MSGVFRLVAWVMVWLGLAVSASAATVTVQWNANPEPDIIGYNVFVSTQAGVFTTPIPVGNRTTWTFPGLQPGVHNYFAVQAQNPEGLSGLAQVAHVSPIPFPAGSEPTRSDFNADGKFDLIWHNQTTGELCVWLMNGATVLNSRWLTPRVVLPDWQLRGSGDLDGDGKPDLVWQNTVTGEIGYWLMDGRMSFAMRAFTPTKVDPTWQIASVRDMDHDGYPDILWNNISTGQVLAWYMNGTNVARLGWINANPLADTNWRLRGTADFTGDGYADLLWQHETTGQPLLWVMNGANATGSILMPSPGTPDWKIMAIGDANEDGHADLVFRNVVTGGVVIWAMNRTNVFSGPYFGVVDLAWKISAPR